MKIESMKDGNQKRILEGLQYKVISAHS